MSMEAGFKISKPHTISSSFSLSHACSSRCKPPVAVSATCYFCWTRKSKHSFFLLVSSVLVLYKAAGK